jgi:hypothetical protein
MANFKCLSGTLVIAGRMVGFGGTSRKIVKIVRSWKREWISDDKTMLQYQCFTRAQREWCVLKLVMVIIITVFVHAATFSAISNVYY